MNRDFKFRVWEPLNKKMHYLNFSLYECDGRLNKFVLPENHQLSQYTNYTYMNLNSVVVTQYIGLKDTDGNEIYEGDILYFEDDNECLTEVVRWDNKYGRFYFDEYVDKEYDKESYYADINDWTIISHFKRVGNIYENPELITA
jgi:uncharacterized phage protein (TIGR01671 family)